MSTAGDVNTTEISVAGANCPWCFNETLDALRAEPGVVAVHGTIGGQCLRVDHTEVATDRLVSIVRQRLHADDISSTEHVMVQIDAGAATLHCTHGRDRTANNAGSPNHV